MTHPTMGTPVAESNTLAAEEVILLSDLAAGKYDTQVAWCLRVLGAIPGLSKVVPIIKLLLLVNKLTAPKVPVVADNQGGFVPISNSRYDPVSGRFI